MHFKEKLNEAFLHGLYSCRHYISASLSPLIWTGFHLVGSMISPWLCISAYVCVCFEKLCTAMHCSVCTVHAWLHWSERECGGDHRCPHHTQDQPHCKHRDNVCECVSPCVWVEWAKGYPLANLNPNASYLFCLLPWYLEPQSVPFSCQTHLFIWISFN